MKIAFGVCVCHIFKYYGALHLMMILYIVYATEIPVRCTLIVEL